MAAGRGRAAPAHGGVAIVAARATARRLAGALEAAGLDVVARVASAARAAESLRAVVPAAVVLAAPEAGPELAATVGAIRSELPDARIVVVCLSASVREMRELFGEGADGIVLDAEVESALAGAVHAVSAGLLVFPRSLRGNVVRPVLSTREKQVLGLVVLGLTNREIAARLHVSESTVKSHLATSFPKLGVRTRREAAALILDPHSGLGTGILAIAGGE